MVGPVMPPIELEFPVVVLCNLVELRQVVLRLGVSCVRLRRFPDLSRRKVSPRTSSCTSASAGSGIPLLMAVYFDPLHG